MKEEVIHPESKYFLYKGYDDYFTINDGLVNEMGGWGERKNCNGGKGIKIRELFSVGEGAAEASDQFQTQGSGLTATCRNTLSSVELAGVEVGVKGQQAEQQCNGA